MTAPLLLTHHSLRLWQVYVSYLPLAHIFERINMLGLLNFGAKIAFVSHSLFTHCSITTRDCIYSRLAHDRLAIPPRLYFPTSRL